MSAMVAKPFEVSLSADSPQNAKNFDGDKERIASRKVLAVPHDPDAHVVTLIDLRLWMGRSRCASVVYASVWVSRPTKGGYGSLERSGTGAAGGYGYCKQSAAACDALSSAGVGVKPYMPHGSGMSEVDRLLRELAALLVGDEAAKYRIVVVEQ